MRPKGANTLMNETVICPNPVFSTGREKKTVVGRDLIKSGGKYE